MLWDRSGPNPRGFRSLEGGFLSCAAGVWGVAGLWCCRVALAGTRSVGQALPRPLSLMLHPLCLRVRSFLESKGFQEKQK